MPRDAQDLPGTYQADDCLDYNYHCIAGNEDAVCEQCRVVCDSTHRAFSHIFGADSPLSNFHRALRDGCVNQRDQLRKVLDRLRREGLPLSYALVPKFPLHSFHCGIAASGFGGV